MCVLWELGGGKSLRLYLFYTKRFMVSTVLNGGGGLRDPGLGFLSICGGVCRGGDGGKQYIVIVIVVFEVESVDRTRAMG